MFVMREMKVYKNSKVTGCKNKTLQKKKQKSFIDLSKIEEFGDCYYKQQQQCMLSIYHIKILIETALNWALFVLGDGQILKFDGKSKTRRSTETQS